MTETHSYPNYSGLPLHHVLYTVVFGPSYNIPIVFYTKGLEAKRAGRWEEAYRYFVRAYKTSSTKGGILRFPEQPQKNNYRYTYSLISRKMDEASKHIGDGRVDQIVKEENLGSSLVNMGPMKERQRSVQQDMQQGIMKKTLTANAKFSEAEELARREKYLEAIYILEEFVERQRTGGEADEAGRLIDEYGKKLDERRRELYDAVGKYLKDNNHKMARELLLKMKKTYPPRPEFDEAQAYIDNLLNGISRQKRAYKKDKNRTEKTAVSDPVIPQ
jgi:tetratricopeptide (TPR) repeat protein